MSALHRKLAVTRRALLAGLATLASLSAPLPVRAQSLADLKTSGQVGERPDGYLGIVIANPPASLVAAVQKLNADRKAVYQQIAQKENSALNQVEVVAGAKLVRDAPPGSYVMDASGRWLKK